ncbi:hypothetical protein P9VFCI_210 [Rhizobium phage P9VFCI]|uniref:Uncharacterized protein n=1 Tax=Rhizobium phage P9VFCI TaxID=2763531 RepID=A0A7G7WXQ6_9CAUD|nr:hypothetical protein PP937_gp210 [Rhizobium phage P9VFCI]QNH72000.1 hypothetical protein P9VFCI_210 [Rhizobium phage P9VFCI]
MSRNVFAYTPPTAPNPGYVNLSELKGEYWLTVRSEMRGPLGTPSMGSTGMMIMSKDKAREFYEALKKEFED